MYYERELVNIGDIKNALNGDIIQSSYIQIKTIQISRFYNIIYMCARALHIYKWEMRANYEPQTKARVCEKRYHGKKKKTERDTN